MAISTVMKMEIQQVILMQVVLLSWRQLDKDTRRAVRLSCSHGRLAVDKQLAVLHVQQPAWSVEPAALHRCVEGLLQRGARLSTLYIKTQTSTDGTAEPTDDTVLERMLTVLGALAARATPADAGQPITILMLHKAPMSMAAADAFLSACPHVKTLHIFTKGDTDIDRETYGMMQLVSRYGPQLQCLHLNWVDGWPTLALQCLASCTALVELGLSYNEFPNTHTLAGEVSILRLICQLRKLSHLELRTANCNTYRTVPATTAQWLAEHQRHATTLQQLSCLTALTHLKLNLAHHRRCDTEYSTLAQMQRDGPAILAPWCSVWNTQQASLMAALRCMPQLLHLDCQHFHLPASEVSALSSLTSLRVAGLAGPTTSPDAPASPPQPGAKVALPPQLRTLWMQCGSVQTLAAVQPPEVLDRVVMGKQDEHELRFSVWDMSPNGKRLLPTAVEAVGAAVGLLAQERERDADTREPFAGKPLVVGTAGPAASHLQPPEGQLGQEGQADHAAWMRKLQPLNRHKVAFSGFALRPADLLCIARTLDMIRVLNLRGCSFLLSALPALAHLPHLRELKFSVQDCFGVTANQLESALLLTAAGARELQKLAACDIKDRNMAITVRQKVRRGLRAHGVEGVRVLIPHNGGGDDDEEEMEAGGQEQGV